jgi:FkbM family methyltransferase
MSERRTVTRDGHIFTVRDPDADSGQPHEAAFWDQFQHSWETDTIGVLNERLRPGDVLVDVGAWIGPVSLYAAKLGAKVYAVEPDPVACHQLREHANWNDADITVWEGMVGAEAGTGWIGRHPLGALGDSMSSMLHATDRVEVPALTLEGLFERFGLGACSLVKIDVEGGEEAILPQAAPFLATLRVPVMLATHAPMFDGDARDTYKATVEAALDAANLSHGEVSDGWGNLLCLPV